MSTISVSRGSDGAFVVTGSGFLANHAVHIRVVDNALANVWFDATSDGDGAINTSVGDLCVNPGELFFSANDEQPDPQDLTGTLWSNTVTMICPISGTPTPTSSPTPTAAPTQTPTPTPTPSPD